MDTVVTFGQHKGETVAEATGKQPDTYLEWCYAHYGRLLHYGCGLGSLWMYTRHLADALKSGGVNPNEVRKAIANNQKLHEEKRNSYKSQMMELYEKEMESKLKGNNINEEDLPF